MPRRSPPEDLYLPLPVGPDECSHAGNMTWGDESARCRACGQMWRLVVAEGRAIRWGPDGRLD